MELKHLVSKSVLLNQSDPEVLRSEVRNYFLKTWEVDELLYTQLKTDDIFYHRGDPLRHILLFYLGHTAVFYINKFMLAGLIQDRISPFYESIFAIGVDEMSWDDLNERHYSWPPVSGVREYRNKAKEVILNIIDNTPVMLPVNWDNPFWIIMMGIEHERIHLETSSVLIRQLPLDEVVAGNFGEICTETAEAPENVLLAVTGAPLKLGKHPDHPLYGWDNEYGNYAEDVADFKTFRSLISNGEFLDFVNDGGYQHKTYWTEEGWKWRTYKEANMPLFWIKSGENYRLRLVAQEIDMPWNWPTEVNYLEAKAYCNWLSAKTGQTYRLPTEAEWYRLAEHSGISDQPDWKETPGNINLAHFASPCPVDMFENGDFYDVIGNVWQWTETPITGFPGFKVHPLYDDFSTPTFDGKHNLIKGGSWISTGNEATLHARYAFRRHFYQHAGFRPVQSDIPLDIRTEEYETDAEVANSCEDMWGENAQINISVQLAGKIKSQIPDLKSMNVLDLNADTGRLAFELAPFVSKVTAIDFSARFIQIPIRLQERGFMRYIVKDELELLHYREVVLENLSLTKDKDKILFMQDNANNLKPIYTGYDLIIVPNLLEELICPISFLSDIYSRLNDRGYLVIVSDYDWERVPVKQEYRPGGFKRDGEPVSSLEGIKEILSLNFRLESKPEDLMKYEWISSRKSVLRKSEMTVWRKI